MRNMRGEKRGKEVGGMERGEKDRREESRVRCAEAVRPMRSRLTAGLTMLLLAVLLMPFGADARKPKVRIKYAELPAKFSGSMMPYDFTRCDSTVAWADSLRPVYLAYVARHGSRYLSGEKKIEMISKALEEAEKKDKLSDEGLKFLTLVREVTAYSSGRWGLLSEVGEKEAARLGADMAKMLPRLFKGGAMNSESTYVPRVIMTMYQFMHSLEIPNKRLEMSAKSGHQFDTLLRCFVADTAYARYREDGAWVPLYEEFLKRHVSDAPARRLFVDGYEENRQYLRHLTMSMYGMLQANVASGLRASTTEFMTVQEFEGCWMASNMHHYLRNNINPVSNLAAQATTPLLQKIISEADAALAQKGAADDETVRGNGYFGHAETLLPLLSLMRMPGCYAMTTDFEKLPETWRIQEITPLAANLAIVLLKGKSGVIYASVRHNGRNVSPLPGKGEIVKWEDLKNYWERMIFESNY